MAVKLCLSVALLLLCKGRLLRGLQVCCTEIGCFSDSPPLIPAPKCPEDLQIDMKVYTQQNKDEGQPITRHSIPSSFQHGVNTMFIVHGWLLDQDSAWLHVVKDTALASLNYNVIIVGWKGGSQNLWYPQSAADTQTVGAEIAMVANNTIVNAGVQRADIHCVGHSLGAHVCGYAGTRLKIGRITGLDPAGPLFENRDWSNGLNPSCADLVDVIHTNGQGGLLLHFGTMKPLGHVDFYPNGGGGQPGCPLDLLFGIADLLSLLTLSADDIRKLDPQFICNHMRAINLFNVSISNSCLESRQKCSSQNSIPLSCISNANVVQSLGYSAIQYPQRGLFYLKTKSVWPYCNN